MKVLSINGYNVENALGFYINKTQGTWNFMIIENENNLGNNGIYSMNDLLHFYKQNNKNKILTCNKYKIIVGVEENARFIVEKDGKQETLKIESFIGKCEKDLKLMKQEVLENDNMLFETNCYKYVLCNEILQLFKSGEGMYNEYAKRYIDKYRPLSDIYSDYITNYTEPKLMTEYKLFRLLEKTEKN